MLDIETLLQSKRLIIISLVSDDEQGWNVTLTSSLSIPKLSLEGLKDLVTVLTSESSASYNILVDDLDVFEMLTPSPQSARIFIQDLTEQLLSESQSLNSIIAFGRQTVANDEESIDSSSRHCNGQPRLSEFFKYK